jgi:hypothetical protein
MAVTNRFLDWFVPKMHHALEYQDMTCFNLCQKSLRVLSFGSEFDAISMQKVIEHIPHDMQNHFISMWNGCDDLNTGRLKQVNFLCFIQFDGEKSSLSSEGFSFCLMLGCIGNNFRICPAAFSCFCRRCVMILMNLKISRQKHQGIQIDSM